MKVFSVYDGKAQAFALPFFMQTIGLAIRAFTEAVNDKQSQLSKYPSDFTLFQVGDYDESKGSFQNLSPHLNLGLASNFVVQAKPVLDMLDPASFPSKEVVK